MRKRTTATPAHTQERIPRWWIATTVIIGALLLIALANLSTVPELPPPPMAQVSGTTEEQLAARYTPVVYLRQQSEACDRRGEPFLPAPVETVLDDPAVALRLAGEDTIPGPVVLQGPTAADLAGKGARYNLDLPGDSENPGCTYEQAFQARMVGREPVVYAHIVREAGRDSLALQYWFFYYFDDFVNTHEGDWEMIQLVFDVPTVAEALATTPRLVAYAQHDGGETAAWDDAKLKKEGGRPVVYPAAGSHGAYFGSGIYLGWGRDGTGFGCDNTTAPSVRVLPRAVLLPDQPDPQGPFAWLLYNGLWGVRVVGPFSGPTGPLLKPQWRRPITWAEGLRPVSVTIPAVQGVGTSATEFFCNATGTVSTGLALLSDTPGLVAGGLLIAVLLALALYRWQRRLIRAAMQLFRKHWALFTLLGTPLILLALSIDAAHFLARRILPGETAGGVVGGPFVSTVTTVVFQLLQNLIFMAIVGPATAWIVAQIRAGKPYSVRQAFREVWRRLPVLVGALLGLGSAYFLLVISLVGIPIAVWLYTRWVYFGQTIMIDGVETSREALSASSRIVRGHWWRVAIMTSLFLFLATVPGPAIGLLLLVTLNHTPEFINTISGLIYACLVPFAVTGQTLLYFALRDDDKATGAATGAARDLQTDPRISGATT